MSRNITILQLFQTNGIGTKTISRIINMLTQDGLEPKDLESKSITELIDQYGISEDAAIGFFNAKDQAENISEELEYQNIIIAVKGQPGYPTNLEAILGNTAPPVLFIGGDFSILEKTSVGVCGSRKASEQGLKSAASCASALAIKGISITSGYAPGVDVVAHKAAMVSGGDTTIVLAEGILGFKQKRAFGDIFTPDNHVVVSEFHPRASWTSYNAMQRNKTICGLSRVVVIVEPSSTGGTYAAGETAIQYNRPLFIVKHTNKDKQSEGYNHFIRKGAMPIDLITNAETSMQLVFKEIFNDHTHIRSTPEQQVLF